jgi:profilin
LRKQGKTGIHVTKTKQCFLVGHYGENGVAGNAAQTVEALADYLTKAGY